MPSISDVCHGIVIQTNTKSLLGPYFYSDLIYDGDLIDIDNGRNDKYLWSQPVLNFCAELPIIGRIAGVIRMAMAVIHSLGHLFAALFTQDIGHCYHAAKGGCEFLRGLIETIPVVGYFFATRYSEDKSWSIIKGRWWIIKIYNPKSPDSLDEYTDGWKSLKAQRPSAYVVA